MLNLVDSVFSLMEGMLPEYALDGRVRQPAGAALPPIAHQHLSLRRWPVALHRRNSDLIFCRLMAAIGRSDLASDPAYATNGLRCENRGALDAAMRPGHGC